MSEAIGIVKRSVTPDSPHSIARVGTCGRPVPLTTHLSFLVSRVAPRDVMEWDVACVSSHESGFWITVSPVERRPANRARCVWAFDGGAVTSPDIVWVGLMVTFKL